MHGMVIFVCVCVCVNNLLCLGLHMVSQRYLKVFRINFEFGFMNLQCSKDKPGMPKPGNVRGFKIHGSTELCFLGKLPAF